MFERFTNIVGGLKALRKDFPNTQLVKKILYSLTKSWRSKVMAIEETRNLDDFKLEELIGSLVTYEMTRRHENEREKPKKEYVKQKGIALNSIVVEEERSTKNESESEEDMAMLARKFNRYMKKN